MAGNEAFTVTVEGGRELEKIFRALGPKALEASAGSLYRSAEKIMSTSKEKFVPVDTGNLRATGHVKAPEITSPSEVSVTLGYGGTAGGTGVNYAVYVHENPNSVHPVGQWKYLETPLKAAVDDIVTDLVDDINEAFRTLA